MTERKEQWKIKQRKRKLFNICFLHIASHIESAAFIQLQLYILVCQVLNRVTICMFST